MDTHNLKQQWAEFERVTFQIGDQPVATGAFDSIHTGNASLRLKSDKSSRDKYFIFNPSFIAVVSSNATQTTKLL